MESQSCPSAPRGDSAQGGKLRHASMSTSTGAVHKPSNLLQKMNDDAVLLLRVWQDIHREMSVLRSKRQQIAVVST